MGERMTTSLVAKRVTELPPSGIRRFFDIVATMHDIISLGIGEPDFATPEHIVQAGADALYNGDTHYTSNPGTLELRQAIADHLRQLYGLVYDPKTEIIVTVGVSEALYLALTALLDPGEEVIVPEPCFVAYVPEIQLAGGVAIRVPTKVEDDFEVTVARIENAITPRTKALLLGYPNNPTGAVMSRERLERIARLAQKHDIAVISDEIYDRLVYGVEHVSFPSLPNMQRRTVLLQGMSKTYAMTGWRIGYAAGPEEIIHGLLKVHQYTIMSAPTPAQVAGMRALQAGEGDVQRMCEIYDRRRRLIVDGLNSIGLSCFEPRGAFYAFPSIQSTGMTSVEFSERLLGEEKVAVVPGNAFGESGEGFVRCSYTASGEDIEEALNRMAHFVQRHLV